MLFTTFLKSRRSATFLHFQADENLPLEDWGLVRPMAGKTAFTMVGQYRSRSVQPRPPTRARILLITFGPVLSPVGGWGVRARSMLDGLADLGLRMTVISDYEDGNEPVPPSIDAIHVLARRPRLGWSLELARAARQHARDADAIIVESALFLPAVRVGLPTAPIIWDTNECETLHYSRLEPRFSNRLRLFVWRQLERWAVRRSQVIVAISEKEAGWWIRLFPDAAGKLVVVRHGSPARPVEDADVRVAFERVLETELKGPALLFVGNLAAKHNAAAAEWLVSELAPQLPGECVLVLAGPGTERLRTRPRSNAQVICLGGVPDIDTVIAGADLCLAPLAAGAGVKTKVLHYLEQGSPVIATPLALEGLEGAPGVVQTELVHFTRHVLDYLADPEDEAAANRRKESQQAWVRARFGRARFLDELRVALEQSGVSVY
jgi:hypothetical protein